MLRYSRACQRLLLQTTAVGANVYLPTSKAAVNVYQNALKALPNVNLSFVRLHTSDTEDHDHDEHEPSEQDKLRMSEVYKILAHPTHSLFYDRGTPKLPPELDNPVGRLLVRLMGFNSTRSKLSSGGKRLYKGVRELADTGEMQKAFNTGNTFWSTYVFLSLHVWMIVWRLRTVSHPDLKHFREWFYLEFQQDVEKRIYASGVEVRVSKWLRTLEEHFFKTGHDLDLVLMGESDRTLTAVVLEMYYANDKTKEDDAEMLAAYIDRELECLKQTEDDVILKGHVKFSCSFMPALEAADINLMFEPEEAGQAPIVVPEKAEEQAGDNKKQ